MLEYKECERLASGPEPIIFSKGVVIAVMDISRVGSELWLSKHQRKMMSWRLFTPSRYNMI